ncbi:hypothetical protein RQP46_003196 [Phenoliferia psychrophenolica]
MVLSSGRGGTGRWPFPTRYIALSLQHHTFLPSGDCLLGNSTSVDVVAVLLDIPSDIGLTILFLIPVYSAKFEGSRPVARRTAIACVLTTITGICDYIAIFHNHGYLTFWIFHLLGAIMMFVGAASVFYVSWFLPLAPPHAVSL